MLQWRVVLAAVLIVPAIGRTGVASNVTTRLKIGVIPRPGMILSKSDLGTSSRNRLSLSRQRSVVPKKDVSLEDTPSHTFSIGGSEFTLRLHKRRDFMLEAPSGASAKLKKKGATFVSVPIPISKKRRYILAFPATYRTSISLRSGSIQKAKIGGKDFSLYDDNMDGYYETEDTFGVGRGSVFAPITKFFSTFSSVHELVNVDREGGEVTYSRYSGDTGKFSMKYLSRGIFAQVAFGSKDAKLNLVLAGRGKQAKVIPGSYDLLYGLATDPSMKKVYAGIVKGDFAALDVKKGAKVVAKMGGPYRLDFTHNIVDKKVTLEPYTIKLFGKNGEQYVSFNIRGKPTVSIMSGGRSAQSERMESG